MIDTETFMEWRGTEITDAPIPGNIREAIRGWRHVVYVLHDMYLGRWMAAGVRGYPVTTLVAAETHEGGIRVYEMPMRFLRLMSPEEMDLADRATR